MASAPQPRRRRAAVVASVALGVVAAVALAVFVIAFVDMGRHTDGGVVASPPPSTTTTTTTSTSALTEAMWGWELRAGDHFKESARALEQVSAAVDANDQAAVRTGCQRLHDTNAIGLQADLPTPDPVLTAELQRMIDDINTAAHACLRFTDTRHPEDATTYQEYLTRAIDHLTTAKQILNEDLGQR
ncbi:hypothetical protein BayCH28_03750 [Mycolicibacterium sp. CH28]|uniref:hypothetical protein n=1 Tax=Mycolicibacterium sp. CH28 TaxID=2512237 RepID=UPI0010821E72|nr:hypothetical protein [Mycolicibacterium sp. CH28]TGD89723.1 hypothetical protein BayCH28_03750 [Mycolicibacterium sp. CH28]